MRAVATAITGLGASAARRRAWAETRYAALVDALRARGIAGAEALDLALKLVPLLARETGWGRGEKNYNVGNLRPSSYGLAAAGAPGWHGDYFEAPNNGRFRAYDTLVDGTYDFVRLLGTDRYRPAFAYLRADGEPGEFYARLIRAGYYPATEPQIAAAADEYRSIYRTVVGYDLRYVPPRAEAAVGPLGLLVLALAAGAAGWWYERRRGRR